MFTFSRAASLAASAAILALVASAPQAQAQVNISSGQFSVTSDGNGATNTYPTAIGFGVGSDGGYSQVQINTTGSYTSPQSLQVAFYQTVAAANTTTGNFTATLNIGTATGYNLIDLAPIFTQGDVPAIYSWDFSIKDLATGAFLYQNIDGVVTGSAIGNLAASGSYLLTADAAMTTLTDPTLTYNPTLTFGAPVSIAATPEPSSLFLLGSGMTGVAAALRRRRIA
jgi:hypothetical protein